MKTIMLFGANGGIGSAIRHVLDADHSVTPVDIDQVDLSSHEAIAEFARSLEGKKFDWIVTAHGYIIAETDLEKQDPEEIEKTFAINTLSIIHITRLVLKHINPGGGMINISSTAGISGNGKYAAYSASKAAVNNFTQAIARNQPDKIFVSICPGPTNTAMREKIGGDASKAQDPSVIAELVRKIVTRQSDYKSGDIVVVRDGQESLSESLD